MAQELAAGGEAAEAICQRLLVRMGDISQYMKALKQRFSVWHNRSHQRTGTLGNERFKSVWLRVGVTCKQWQPISI